MQGYPVRTARAALAFAAVLALVFACCANKKEEASETSGRNVETTPNVSITNYSSAPDVELRALNGSTVRLSSFQGKIVILSILATWNTDCQAQITELNELADLERFGFPVLGVFMDKGGKAAVQTFVQRNLVRFPVYYNGEEVAAGFHGVRQLPTTYFILRDGSIYRKELGLCSRQRLKATISEIKGQRL